MTNRPSQSLQDLISWKFTLAAGGMMARYGEYSGSFYRQYLPGGISVPTRHPPKRIEPKLYQMAQKQVKA